MLVTLMVAPLNYPSDFLLWKEHAETETKTSFRFV